MRLVKDAVVRVWQEERAAVQQQIGESKRRIQTIQAKLDRLNEAFIFDQTADIDTYDRHRDRLHADLTLARHRRAQIQPRRSRRGRHPRVRRTRPAVCSDLWVQVSLEQRQHLQKLFFPEGIAFNGNSSVRTPITASAFSYLGDVSEGGSKMVAPPGLSSNTIRLWLDRIEQLRRLA